MTNYEVRTRLTELQTVFPAGMHWNHKPGVSEGPDSCSSTPCGTDGYTCNYFSGGIQCYAFANYMAQLVFGSYPTCGSAPAPSNGTIYNGWKVYTADYCEDLTIEPGDIIRAWGMNRDGSRSKHSAIVHYVDGNTVQVAEFATMTELV